MEKRRRLPGFVAGALMTAIAIAERVARATPSHVRARRRPQGHGERTRGLAPEGRAPQDTSQCRCARLAMACPMNRYTTAARP
jgi:hypothetical protein